MIMGLTLGTKDGEFVELEERPFGKGGEGEIYRIIRPDKYRMNCAKIFTAARAATNSNNCQKNLDKLRNKEKKLQCFLANAPDKIENDRFLLCWPLALLYDSNNKFYGYMMPLADNNSVCLYLIKPSNFYTCKKLPDIFKKKYDRSSSAGLRNRMMLCTNIAIAISILHKNGIVVVDLKPDNIQITHEGRVFIVDIDSLQVKKKDGGYYKAEVATLEYSPPEKLSGKIKSTNAISDTWDRFCCAVLFYELLLGVHPYNATFTSKYEKYTSLADKICHGLFPFGKKSQYLSPLPSGHPHLNFRLLPARIQNKFIETFVDGNSNPNNRPRIDEWGIAFYKSVKEGKISGLKDASKKVRLNKPSPSSQSSASSSPTAPQSSSSGNEAKGFWGIVESVVSFGFGLTVLFFLMKLFFAFFGGVMSFFWGIITSIF